MRGGLLAGLTGLCATLAACGGSPPPPPAATAAKPVAAVPAPTPVTPPPATTAAQPTPLVPTPAVPQASGSAYEPKGRRDPFVVLDITGGPKGLEVVTTKLTGIVRSARTTLALVETQDGIGYILKPGDTLGDGRVLEIGADNVIFAVPPKPGSPTNRVVLKLAAN
jgi:Tfp pilus assembly protein PilP